MYKRCGCKILYDFHLMQNYAKIHILLAFSEYNLIDQRDTSLKIFINEVSTSKIPGECPIRGDTKNDIQVNGEHLIAEEILERW